MISHHVVPVRPDITHIYTSQVCSHANIQQNAAAKVGDMVTQERERERPSAKSSSSCPYFGVLR